MKDVVCLAVNKDRYNGTQVICHAGTWMQHTQHKHENSMMLTHHQNVYVVCFITDFKLLKNIATWSNVWLMPELNHLYKWFKSIITIMRFTCKTHEFSQFGFLKSRSVLMHMSGFKNSSWAKLVELGGIEPPTSCVQGRRSPSWAIAPFYWSFFCCSALYLSLFQSRTDVRSFNRYGVRLDQQKKSCVKNSRKSLFHFPVNLLIMENVILSRLDEGACEAYTSMWVISFVQAG